MSTLPGPTHCLIYADAPAAIDFLVRAFGFTLKFRMDMEDGRVGHSELTLGPACVAISSEFPEMGLKSPGDLDFRYSQAQVYVSDVDAHHTTAVDAGATAMQPPTDQPYGDRMYRAVDPEGHRWIFSQRVKEVPPEVWMGEMGG